MIPLYGFLEGDTLGVLLLVAEDENMVEVAAKLQAACALRVAPRAQLQLMHEGRVLAPELTVAAAELAPLDRIDGVSVRP